jgi:hypothetical protein
MDEAKESRPKDGCPKRARCIRMDRHPTNIFRSESGIPNFMRVLCLPYVQCISVKERCDQLHYDLWVGQRASGLKFVCGKDSVQCNRERVNVRETKFKLVGLA